jgi:hypothetical protein
MTGLSCNLNNTEVQVTCIHANLAGKIADGGDVGVENAVVVLKLVKIEHGTSCKTIVLDDPWYCSRVVLPVFFCSSVMTCVWLGLCHHIGYIFLVVRYDDRHSRNAECQDAMTRFTILSNLATRQLCHDLSWKSSITKSACQPIRLLYLFPFSATFSLSEYASYDQ